MIQSTHPSAQSEREQQHTEDYGNLSELQQAFAESCEPTIGVEVELFLVDEQTGQPVAIYDDVYALLPPHIQQQTQPEFLACQIEYATTPHRDIAGIRAELEDFEQAVTAAAAQLGARPEWTAILPDWEFDPAMIRDSERARWNAERFGESASILAACSVHIHVAVPRHQAIQVADGLQQFVPLLVALSANSPQMPGTRRHVSSQRAAMWAHDLPTSGFPRLFGDWDNFTRHVELLRDFGVITSQKDLYYFVRPTRYGTIEVRCCDLPPSLDHVIALASLVQASAVRFQRGCPLPIPADILHADLANAITHGSQAMLTSCELSHVPLSDCFASLLSELLPIGAALDNDKGLMAANCLLEGAGRQRRKSNDPGKKGRLVGRDSSHNGSLVTALRRWSPRLTLATSVCLFLAAAVLNV
ncbi:MAG: carboxylate-amine ligase [Planctomycetaceae bacterium]|jgi:carboxylate-amine ligase